MMQNIETQQTGNILTITIDLSKRCGVSKSGKSESIASTGGNVPLPDSPDIRLGLNCYIPTGK